MDRLKDYFVSAQILVDGWSSEYIRENTQLMKTLSDFIAFGLEGNVNELPKLDIYFKSIDELKHLYNETEVELMRLKKNVQSIVRRKRDFFIKYYFLSSTPQHTREDTRKDIENLGLTKQNEHMKREITRLKEQYESLTSKLIELQSQYISIEDDKNKLVSVVSELLQQKSELTEDIQRLTIEKQKITRAMCFAHLGYDDWDEISATLDLDNLDI